VPNSDRIISRFVWGFRNRNTNGIKRFLPTSDRGKYKKSQRFKIVFVPNAVKRNRNTVFITRPVLLPPGRIPTTARTWKYASMMSFTNWLSGNVVARRWHGVCYPRDAIDRAIRGRLSSAGNAFLNTFRHVTMPCPHDFSRKRTCGPDLCCVIAPTDLRALSSDRVRSWWSSAVRPRTARWRQTRLHASRSAENPPVPPPPPPPCQPARIKNILFFFFFTRVAYMFSLQNAGRNIY